MVGYQSLRMADITAIFGGGRSLEIIAIKKYPAKRTKPIETNNHPQNFLSSYAAN